MNSIVATGKLIISPKGTSALFQVSGTFACLLCVLSNVGVEGGWVPDAITCASLACRRIHRLGHVYTHRPQAPSSRVHRLGHAHNEERHTCTRTTPLATLPKQVGSNTWEIVKGSPQGPYKKIDSRTFMFPTPDYMTTLYVSLAKGGWVGRPLALGRL